MSRRTLIGAAAVTVLGLTVSACSSDAPGSAAAAGSDSSKPSVQFVNPLPNYPAWRTIGDCMKKQAQTKGFDFVETGPTGTLDATKMIQQVQQGIANKKDAIVTFPASEGFASVLQQAQKAGVVTVTMYGSGTADSGADANVGVDWSALGEQYVKAIAERPGQQNVGLIAVADTGVGKSWLDGMKTAAAKTANVKIVGEVYTGDDAAKALPQTSALLTAHPDINVVATHMGTVTPGAIAAIKSKGKTSSIAFLANGPDNGGKEGLASGGVWRLLVQDLCGEGADAVNAVSDKLGNKASTASTVPFVKVGTALASKDDLQSYLGKGWG
jgi:ABC-type sugar transport system substrate-binding protein